MQHLPSIPFSYAKANQILLIKGVANGAAYESGEVGVPTLIHSPQTDLAVLQEICRLVGPIRRIEQTSEEVLEALNAAYAEGFECFTSS